MSEFPEIVSTGSIPPGPVKVGRAALAALRALLSPEWAPKNGFGEVLCSFAPDDESRDPSQRGHAHVRFPNGVMHWFPLEALTPVVEQVEIPGAA